MPNPVSRDYITRTRRSANKKFDKASTQDGGRELQLRPGTKVLWEMGELTMEEIQHVGIVVSQANGCPYCTAAFCTILNHGLGTAEDYVGTLLQSGVDAIEGDRLRALLEYALQVNQAPADVSDQQVEALRAHGLSDKGIVQLTHVVSDFSSYNTLNLALDTDYDYRNSWRELAGFSAAT